MLNDENCAVCGGDEDIFGCSTCPSSFHLDCHEPPLRMPPRYNPLISMGLLIFITCYIYVSLTCYYSYRTSTWKCMQCKSGIRIRKKSERTTAKSRLF